MTQEGFKWLPKAMHLIWYWNSCNSCKAVNFFLEISHKSSIFTVHLELHISPKLLRMGDWVFGFVSGLLLNFMPSNSIHIKKTVAVYSCRGTFSSSHNLYSSRASENHTSCFSFNYLNRSRKSSYDCSKKHRHLLLSHNDTKGCTALPTKGCKEVRPNPGMRKFKYAIEMSAKWPEWWRAKEQL